MLAPPLLDGSNKKETCKVKIQSIEPLSEDEISAVGGSGMWEEIYKDGKHFIEGIIDGLFGLPERKV